MPRRKGYGSDWWQGRFRGCGYKITAGREVILDVLSCSTGHVSAEDIFFKVRSKYPGIGLTTIYRTLEILVTMGLVYQFDFGDGRARYELAEREKGKDHHHHLICTICNRIVDYTDFINEEVKLLTQTERGLSKKYHFKITKHMIQFYGICERCSGKNR